MGLHRLRDDIFRKAVDLLADHIQFEQVTESQKHPPIWDPVADQIDPSKLTPGGELDQHVRHCSNAEALPRLH